MIELQDAAWLAHRYDEASDNYQFVHLPRGARGEATFLSDEYLPPDLHTEIVSRSELGVLEPNRTPIHFIFHSGFCCSTLLTRALELPGKATSLSEPTLLRDMVGFFDRGAHRDRYPAVFARTLQLLARPFEPGEAVIAKPSCVVNRQAKTILATSPSSQAIFLYAPIRVFLNSIARKGITGRLWGRELFRGLHGSNRPDLGFSEEELFGQTDLQIAGLAWLVQNRIYQLLLAEFGEERIRSLDSESFLARPAETLEGIGSLFDLGIGSVQAQEIAHSDVFHRHSKFGEKFDADERKRERAAGDSAHADEIEKVALWVETVARGLGIAMQPAGRLLD
ncbi:hypothetical protein [Parasphingopyxis lamellibrachiae]|uniref:Sulfotransferase family protein n=1 Tax=Parasphingopyxis lamellibrachiae TaxID=680125 RepID=A0A3D9FHH4_9SPHN|nr:hypothetical protein [Parasphingopyxis lamellibrachiae]RED17249.1 hypothetical protein DFR46_2288 [Parasphingopyxis lamellibrachiae]